MNIDLNAFEFAISKIDDGWIFERFGLEFLSASQGYEFIPVGGSKDKGVDAFQHIYSKEGKSKFIFQLSTELSYEAKIRDTIIKLESNNIHYDKIFYVTNRVVQNAERIIDNVSDELGKNLVIWDIRWFKIHACDNEKTINSYQLFIDTYFHEYSQPGKTNVIANLDTDPRLFVFLSQQFDIKRGDFQIDNLLVDTLILYSLEGTDPDKDIFLTEVMVREKIKNYIKFDPKIIELKIHERLIELSKKPRKIKFHSKKMAYCIPYETRLEIEQRNLKDEKILNDFYAHTNNFISKFLKDSDIKVKDIQGLIVNVFNKIYYRQGLEFSNFILHGDSKSIVEQNLNDVINEAVDTSNVIIINKEKVKNALHLAIRDIVYNGTIEQMVFLKSLSNTYLMMFLLHWDPKISLYFQTLASKLIIFVDTSVIIPALSELFLQETNRRHWNLLTSATKSGIKLFINETMLNELVTHFRMIKSKYNNYLREAEDFYSSEEGILFVDEIMLRSYFHAKGKKRVKNFPNFIDNFTDYSMSNAKDDLVVYLKDIFGIEYISNYSWDIKVNPEEKKKLVESLKKRKDSDVKAENDSELILSIYQLREKNNEIADIGIFGYKTWWLSKDTSTFKAVTEAFGNEKFPVSCYIRPDFIYNYIALKPTPNEIDEAYQEIFPTMLGVNLSYHMPKEVSQTIQERLKDFYGKQPTRIKQKLKNLSDKLKSDPSLRNRNSINNFFENLEVE